MLTPTAPETRLQRGFGAGAGAAIALMVIMAIVRLATGVPSIPELLQGALLRLVPGDLFEFMIHLLKAGAKVLLLVSVLEGMLLAGGALGWLFVRWWRPAGPNASPFRRLMADRYWSGLVYGVAIGFGLVVLFILLYLSGFMNPQPSSTLLVPESLTLLLYGAVFGLSLVSLLPWPGSEAARAAAQTSDERRGFLRLAGGTALALVAGAGLWGILAKVLAEPEAAGLVTGEAGTPIAATGPDATVTAEIATAIAQAGPTNTPVPPVPSNTAVPPTAGGQASATAGPATATPGSTAVAQAPPSATPTVFPAVPVLPPEVTPTSNFYITTKNFTDPTVDASQWSLSIKGLVDHPMTLTLDQIKALPSVQVFHTLECISNTVGGDLIGNALWKGIHMADLMQQAGPQKGVVDAVFRAADDYSDSVPLAALVDPNTVLAYEMNGKPLEVKHGFPARLLIPGIFGMKNVKWLTTIELVNYDYKGFWQSQGWSDPAPYLTTSQISYPTSGVVQQKPLYVGGIAFAGNRGISKVEVSVDAGKTWNQADLRRALGPNTWVLWTYPWIPPATGDTTLVVRATDGTGQLQDPQDANNYPDGAMGYHRVPVKIVSA